MLWDKIDIIKCLKKIHWMNNFLKRTLASFQSNIFFPCINQDYPLRFFRKFHKTSFVDNWYSVASKSASITFVLDKCFVFSLTPNHCFKSSNTLALFNKPLWVPLIPTRAVAANPSACHKEKGNIVYIIKESARTKTFWYYRVKHSSKSISCLDKYLW